MLSRTRNAAILRIRASGSGWSSGDWIDPLAVTNFDRSSAQFLAPYGARLRDEGLDASKHSLCHSPVEPLKLLASCAGEPDPELTPCV